MNTIFIYDKEINRINLATTKYLLFYKNHKLFKIFNIVTFIIYIRYNN